MDLTIGQHASMVEPMMIKQILDSCSDVAVTGSFSARVRVSGPGTQLL